MTDNNGNAGNANNNSNDVININDVLGGGNNPIPINPPVIPEPIVPQVVNNGEGQPTPTTTPQPQPIPQPQGTQIPAGLGGNEPPITTPVPVNEPFKDIITSFLDANITEDLKADRDALLSGFKATNLDATGNLLNAEGKIVLSADKVQAFVLDNKLPLNEKLEVVNDLGEVVKSREDYLTENSVITPVKTKLEQEFGITLPADLQFSDDENGIAELTTAVVKQVRQSAVGGFLQANPEIKGFAEHLALGGTAQNYSSSAVDYKSVKVKDIEVDAKVELIKKALTFQGNPDPDGFVKLVKGAGEEEINKHTSNALVYLDKKQTEDNANRTARVEAQIAADKQESEQYWNQVNTVVASGKVGMLQIPTTERQAFYDYMSKPINEDGDSQFNIDNDKTTLDFDLSTAYLLYKGGDISKVAAVIAKADRVQTLKERMAKFGTTGTGSGVPSTEGNSKKGFVPDINILTGRK